MCPTSYLFCRVAQAKPPAESVDEVVNSGILSRIAQGTKLYSDGAFAYPAAVKRLRRRKRFSISQVAHVHSEFTKKVDRGQRIAGTQLLDRFLNLSH